MANNCISRGHTARQNGSATSSLIFYPNNIQLRGQGRRHFWKEISNFGEEACFRKNVYVPDQAVNRPRSDSSGLVMSTSTVLLIHPPKKERKKKYNINHVYKLIIYKSTFSAGKRKNRISINRTYPILGWAPPQPILRWAPAHLRMGRIDGRAGTDLRRD